jgi:hypothetical protein
MAQHRALRPCSHPIGVYIPATTPAAIAADCVTITVTVDRVGLDEAREATVVTQLQRGVAHDH